jgi:hypothetical protein
MSIAKHYMAVEESSDSRAALSYVFLAGGDAMFTAEKRVGECFFTRGRGRNLNTDLYSYVQSVTQVDEFDDHVEENLTDARLNILNKYLKSKIDQINNEFESEKRVTKNISGLILDLKSVYSIILSQVHNVDELKDVVTPNISEAPWTSNWEISQLMLPSLDNYTEQEIKPKDKGETKLIKLIKEKIEFDRYKILDNLINHFKEIDREDIIETIKLSKFKFINDTSNNIANIYNLNKTSYNIVNTARINYISKRKLDLKYSQELVGINASTYKKRSSRIKLEMIDLGEELKTGNLNLMQDYLIN